MVIVIRYTINIFTIMCFTLPPRTFQPDRAASSPTPLLFPSLRTGCAFLFLPTTLPRD